MPSPREIALTKNTGPGAQLDSEPDDEEINPSMKEPDYRSNPRPEREVERLPFKNLRGG
jgi:hypothetical protein